MIWYVFALLRWLVSMLHILHCIGSLGERSQWFRNIVCFLGFWWWNVSNCVRYGEEVATLYPLNVLLKISGIWLVVFSHLQSFVWEEESKLFLTPNNLFKYCLFHLNTVLLWQPPRLENFPWKLYILVTIISYGTESAVECHYKSHDYHGYPKCQ